MAKTTVIFRTYKSGEFKGDVDALFPTIPCKTTFGFIQVYTHVGQHSCGDYNAVISQTRLAKPNEYKDLKKELESIGYNLKVVKKMTPKMRKEYENEYHAMMNPGMGVLGSKYSLAEHGMELLIDDHHGIYLPQEFAKRIDLKKWKGLSKKDYKILLKGPYDPEYWEAWDDVLANAEYKDSTGKWSLYQDGPLFLVHEDFDWEQIY